MKNIEVMSFDELLALRERLLVMIGRRVKTVRRKIREQLAQLDGLTRGL